MSRHTEESSKERTPGPGVQVTGGLQHGVTKLSLGASAAHGSEATLALPLDTQVQAHRQRCAPQLGDITFFCICLCHQLDFSHLM